jgi:phosphotransferase system IIA component
MAGVVQGLGAVGDRVFATEMVGPGCAILPELGEPGELGESVAVSPVRGVLATVHPHAFVVRSGPVRSVLVHLGIDTVGLRGEGFTTLLEAGAEVEVGDPVARWDTTVVVRAGLSALCPVVAVQAASDTVRWLVRPGARVAAGDPLLAWD